MTKLFASPKRRTKEQRRAQIKTQEPVMTARRWRLERVRIWRDMTGCICPNVIIVDGKAVRLKRDEICTSEAIRCNGRLKRWSKDAVSLGPEPEIKA